MDLMLIMGFNGNYNGVYWYVIGFIGGMLNHIGKRPKHTTKRTFVMVLLKLMVYNGILMESIGISVMVSIGLPLFFLAGLIEGL